MTETTEGDSTCHYSDEIQSSLPNDPAHAFKVLIQIPSAELRSTFFTRIAWCWARQDINTAWNTVARSSLSASEKQAMLNELWG